MKQNLLIILFILSGCREFKAELKVVGEFVTVMSDGTSYTLPRGSNDVSIVLSQSKSEPSRINLPTIQKEFHLLLPSANEILNLKSSVFVAAGDNGQSFDVTIQREVSIDDDIYALSFSDPATSQVLATLMLRAEGSEALYDKTSSEFLASYQKVKYSQRGLLFAVDAGSRFPWKGLENVVSGLAHFAVIVLYAPWAYSRYPHVEWLVGGEWDDPQIVTPMWERLFQKAPVVDFFALLHGWVERRPLSLMAGVPRKRNQLRVGYAQGCETGSSANMIQDYNFSVASGFRSNSNSPFYTFAIFRNWIYGRTYAEALEIGSRAGISWQRLLGIDLLMDFWGDSYGSRPWADFNDMIYQSDPMVSWTSELPPNQVAIHLSAVPLRETPETLVTHETDAASIRAYVDNGRRPDQSPFLPTDTMNKGESIGATETFESQ